MTEVYAFTVTLEKELRMYDAEAIINAIRMIRGVVDVVPIVSDSAYYVATVQARGEIREQILNLLYPEKMTV